MIAEWLKALLYGIVEGITEWLPVSSTGHLILLEDHLPFAFSNDAAFLAAFWEFFEVVVQLGAVLAVPTLFWKALIPLGSAENKKATLTLWLKILLASLPVALFGTIGIKLMEKLTGQEFYALFYRPSIVAAALIGYGFAFFFADALCRHQTARAKNLEGITSGQAISIGAFQVLSLIPGTSRSGSTMLGGVLSGIAKEPASRFSFFLAIPAMAGAVFVKGLHFFFYLRETGTAVPSVAWGILLFASVVSYLTSLVAIRFLLGVVKRYGLTPFGVYRILLGLFLLLSIC